MSSPPKTVSEVTAKATRGPASCKERAYAHQHQTNQRQYSQAKASRHLLSCEVGGGKDRANVVRQNAWVSAPESAGATWLQKRHEP